MRPVVIRKTLPKRCKKSLINYRKAPKMVQKWGLGGSKSEKIGPTRPKRSKIGPKTAKRTESALIFGQKWAPKGPQGEPKSTKKWKKWVPKIDVFLKWPQGAIFGGLGLKNDGK